MLQMFLLLKLTSVLFGIRLQSPKISADCYFTDKVTLVCKLSESHQGFQIVQVSGRK